MTSADRHCRAIWLSDLHLGERHCRARYLLHFLRYHHSEYLFLVGDVVDMQALKRRWHWPEEHQQILQLLRRKAKQGTKVIYIPGNHDDALRDWVGSSIEQVEIHREYVYHSPSHGKLLMVHGDEFDRQMCTSRLEGVMGDYAYDLVLMINSLWNGVRRLFGKPYQSVARTIKQWSPAAEAAMNRYRSLAVGKIKNTDFDGIVCGHIHNPELLPVDGKLYINTGDWLENCTAVLEHHDGRLELSHYSEQTQELSAVAAPVNQPRTA